MALIDSLYFSGSLDPLTTGALKHFNYKDVVLVTPCKTMIPKTHYSAFISSLPQIVVSIYMVYLLSLICFFDFFISLG